MIRTATRLILYAFGAATLVFVVATGPASAQGWDYGNRMRGSLFPPGQAVGGEDGEALGPLDDRPVLELPRRRHPEAGGQRDGLPPLHLLQRDDVRVAAGQGPDARRHRVHVAPVGAVQVPRHHRQGGRPRHEPTVPLPRSDDPLRLMSSIVTCGLITATR